MFVAVGTDLPNTVVHFGLDDISDYLEREEKSVGFPSDKKGSKMSIHSEGNAEKERSMFRLY